MRAIQVFVSVQSDKKVPVYVCLFVCVFVARPATVILEDDQYVANYYCILNKFHKIKCL